MSTRTDLLAWLEDSNHQRFPIAGTCSFGRAASNQMSLPSDLVSRRHAIIQTQRENEYWLVDFGSRNGTYLNSQRILHPTRLRDRDSIQIGPFTFVFHLPRTDSTLQSTTVLGENTMTDFRRAKCWLLVTDIVDSTRLLRNLSPEEVPVVTGQWVAECKRTIEEHGGRINQFMGDGFFAYWHDRARSEILVHKALQVLRRLQDHAFPAFRLVLHFGDVVIGGVSVGEEERISGEHVHMAFRLEKLAGGLGELRLMSEPAWERLAALFEARELGEHSVPSFDAKVKLYAF